MKTSTTTTHIVQPPDTNMHGTLFGGTIMGWMDICAAIEASRWCGGACVTACVDKIEFKKPIELGSIVKIVASIASTGKTSMKVSIRVNKERIDDGFVTHCLTGSMTFVAVDKEGRPREFK